MLKKTSFQDLNVQYDKQTLPDSLMSSLPQQILFDPPSGKLRLRACSQALVMIIANERSTIEKDDGGGYRLCTQNVADFISDDLDKETSTKKRYSIVSYCTLEDLQDFKLDPPKQNRKY